jgi:hypothetical protein
VRRGYQVGTASGAIPNISADARHRKLWRRNLQPTRDTVRGRRASFSCSFAAINTSWRARSCVTPNLLPIWRYVSPLRRRSSASFARSEAMTASLCIMIRRAAFSTSDVALERTNRQTNGPSMITNRSAAASGAECRSLLSRPISPDAASFASGSRSWPPDAMSGWTAGTSGEGTPARWCQKGGPPSGLTAGLLHQSS